MQRPFFSIIIPVYNVEKYLRKCLDSVLEQNFLDYEIIAIDDCSSDNSWAILTSYLNNSQKIRLFRNDKNKGLGATRNFGIKNANGIYLIFIDSDDWIEPGYLWEINKHLQEKNHPDILMVGMKIYDEKNHKFLNAYYPRKNKINKPGAFLSIIKKDFAQAKNALFAENLLFEDNLWTYYLIHETSKLAITQIQKYIYRVRENSIMNSKNIKSEDIFIVFEQLRNKLNDDRYFKAIFLKHLFVYLTVKFSKQQRNKARLNFKNIYRRIPFSCKMLTLQENIALILIKLKLYFVYDFLIAKFLKTNR